MAVKRYGSPVMTGLPSDFQDEIRGHDPLKDPKREAPSPTRTCAHPFTETAQRKPYLPTEDLREPTLEEGVSFRQEL